ncbi:TPA: hypothetical protein ACKPZ6_004837 [Serratia liquefaciens]
MQQDIADSLRGSLAYFHQYCRYPLERLVADYQYEIMNYRDDTWEAPQRAARLSAAVKNYKTSQMIEFIFDMAINSGIDLTPLVVKRLCANLFQRKGSQSIIVDVFGKKARTHRSTDSNIERINDISERYRGAATKYWSATLSDIAKAKIGYQKEIRVLKKKKAANID